MALHLHGDSCWTRARWRGIISYEPSELVVTARAGTPLARAGGRLGRARPVPGL